MASDDEIRDAMTTVEDPELGVNVVDLGLVYGIRQEDGGKVIIDMTLTSMGCPLTEQILGDSQAAVMPLDGVESVDINWVWDPPWSPEQMTDEGRLMMKVMGYG